jgi:hypothetical protein
MHSAYATTVYSFILILNMDAKDQLDSIDSFDPKKDSIDSGLDTSVRGGLHFFHSSFIGERHTSRPHCSVLIQFSSKKSCRR